MLLEPLTYMLWSLVDLTDDVEVKLDLFEKCTYLCWTVIVKRVEFFKQPPWFNADLAKSIDASDAEGTPNN